MSPSILETGEKHTKELAKVQAAKPHKFTVGGTFDGHVATGGLSYDYKWSNLWGLTAYARAWYNDAPVIPTDKFGYVVGVEVEKGLERRR